MEKPIKPAMSLWKKLFIGAMALVLVFKIFGIIVEDQKSVPALIQIREVSGKTLGEVEKILGKGTLESKWKNDRAGCSACPRYSFQAGKYDIIFINDIADRITINRLGNYEYDDEVIMGLLGLPDATPSIQNDLIKRWSSIEGYREIMAFNENGKVNHLMVFTNAE